MNKFIYIAIAVLFFIGCSTINNNEGSLVIQSPSGLSHITRSIVDSSSDFVALDNDKLFKINLFVLIDGTLIGNFSMDPDTEKVMSVPSGISIDVYAALYYAEGENTNAEEYNVYLSYAKKTGVILMSGESKTIDLTLNLKESNPVTFYKEYSFNKVTGSAVGEKGVYFSMMKHFSGNKETGEIIKYTNGSIKSVRKTDDILFHSDYTPLSGKNVFIANSKGIYLESNPELEPVEPPVGYDKDINSEKYTGIIDLKSFKITMDGDIPDAYYYLFTNKTGYISLNHLVRDKDTIPSWSYLGDIDFSFLPSGNAFDPFIYDIAQDSKDFKWVHFVTKFGLFYIRDTLVNDIINGDVGDALAQMKKCIVVRNENGANEVITITKVADTENIIYLGTKLGVYKINKLSSEWNNFITIKSNDFIIFDNSAIQKVNEFRKEESITTLKTVTNQSGEIILIVATPNRVVFTNSTGKSKEITVFDGLPFIPLKTYSSMPELNYSEYKKQFTTNIKDVVYNNGVYFFITDYGLASIEESLLF